MTAAPLRLSERLGRFATRARQQACGLELHHITRGLVARIDEGDSIDGADLELMACDHAAALHGRQGYELRAVYDEGKTKQVLPFRVSGESAEDDAIAEPATEKGVIAILARQNERLMAACLSAQKPAIEALETLGKMLSAYREHDGEIFKSMIEISSMQAERDLERRRDELTSKKFDVLERRFGPIVEAIAAKWLPSSLVPRDEGLLRFVQSLDPGQRAAIEKLLTPEQQALLASQKFAELMASVIDSGQIAEILPMLRPEQIAMLDVLASRPGANGANGANGGIHVGGQ